jgi:phage terminase large subunit-like protein
MAVARRTVDSYMQDPAMQALANYMAPTLRGQFTVPDICDYLEAEYYIQDEDLGEPMPITLLPHQKTILRFMFSFVINWRLMIYSTVKKSGKTAIAGAVARYVAEHFGPRNEVLCMANDLEQAKGRIYKAMCDSIELNPKFDRSKNVLSNKWRIIQREATCIKNGTTVRAVSVDYKGEAGSNPACTLWSELWGYSSEASKRLWAELTPVPTRRRSFRFVETYAGYADESDILIELYDLVVKRGRRVTREELEPYGGWPYEDEPPLFVNEEAAAVAYWDEGEIARRMPWQTPSYYASQQLELTQAQFERLHLNWWTQSVSQFAPVEWWQRLANPQLGLPNDNTPLVLGADASVTGDCTALVAFSRHPDPLRHGDLAQRYVKVWRPTRESPMDYTNTIEAEIRRLCASYNVVELAYDPYQLHKMGTDLSREAVCWSRPFNQGIEREKADYQYYTMVRDKAIEHIGDPDAEEHFKNAGTKMSKDEDTKLRIVKRSKDKHIDITVASSMAAAECKRLNL